MKLSQVINIAKALNYRKLTPLLSKGLKNYFSGRAFLIGKRTAFLYQRLKKKIGPHWFNQYRTYGFLKRFLLKHLVKLRFLGLHINTKLPLRQKLPFAVAAPYLFMLARCLKADLSVFLKKRVRLKFTFVYNNTLTLTWFFLIF